MMTDNAVQQNPFNSLPVMGHVIRLLDKFLIDLKFTLGWVETVEFSAIVALSFISLNLLLHRGVPRAATTLLNSVDKWIIAIPAVLLVPEWLTTKALCTIGRCPGKITYAYGDYTFLFTDGVKSALCASLRIARSSAAHSRPMTGALVLLGFLMWNNATCVDTAASCVSPAQQWVQVIGQQPRH